MTTIDINGAALHYETDGTGPPILFIHGMCGDASVWAEQAARLSEGYTSVRYDRRGHSRSTEGDAPITYTQHADDAAALIEALGLAPLLLVGSSGGAAIGIDVALRYAHLLRGAVFSEPALFSVDPQAADAAMRDLGPLVEAAAASDDVVTFVDDFFGLMCPGLWDGIDERRRDVYRNNGRTGLTEALGPKPNITAADIATIAMPTLVLAGATSHPALRTVAHVIARTLPDARFVELAQCGHVTYAEQPDAFEHAVRTFAAELDRLHAREGVNR